MDRQAGFPPAIGMAGIVYKKKGADMPECKKCGRKLKHDEIGLYRRLVDREADSCLCITCFARYYGVSEEILKDKIQFFKDAGCSLF